MIPYNVTVLGVNYDSSEANSFNSLIPHEATIIPITSLSNMYNLVADKEMIKTTFSQDFKELKGSFSVYSSKAIAIEPYLKQCMIWTDNPYEADVLAFPEEIKIPYQLVNAIICTFPNSNVLNVYNIDYHILEDEQVLYTGPCALIMNTFL